MDNDHQQTRDDAAVPHQDEQCPRYIEQCRKRRLIEQRLYEEPGGLREGSREIDHGSNKPTRPQH
jgi:hypothetical protein